MISRPASSPRRDTHSSPCPIVTSRLHVINTRNDNFKDTTFSLNSKAGPGTLDTLSRCTAPSAILNSGGRADEVRSHPGTREHVVQRIERWRDAQDGNTPPLFWLSGPAGAGKSAIMQTIAERWKDQGVPQANFFFFRADKTRNTAPPLVPTLLHQILTLYPSLSNTVATAMSTNPSIFDTILDEQLERLIVAPLRAIRKSPHSYRPLVVLVDGLDECDSDTKNSQQQILRAFDKTLVERFCPFRLLIASRDEPQIRQTFDQLSSPVLRIDLDDNCSPESDIRRFLTERFAEIRRMHYLSSLDGIWPSKSAIDKLVAKSSGQSIYVATVLRFISESSASPRLRLEEVLGLVPSVNGSPSPQLDALYAYVLSRASDQQLLKDLLHVVFVLQSFDKSFNTMLQRILRTYDCTYTNTVIHTCINDVAAIARYEHRSLSFYHASLPEFLQDESRSGGYYVNLPTFGPKILPAIWEHVGKKQGVQFGARFASTELKSLLPDFMKSITALKPADFETFGDVQEMRDVFIIVYSLCKDNSNVANYKRMLRKWTILYMSLVVNHSQDKELADIHDIPCAHRYIVMAEIDREQDDLELTPERANVLCPLTPSDIYETAIWVRDLLQRIQEKYYFHDPQRYKRILREWIFWGISNNIPLKYLDRHPYARWYYWTGTIRKWGGSSS